MEGTRKVFFTHDDARSRSLLLPALADLRAGQVYDRFGRCGTYWAWRTRDVLRSVRRCEGNSCDRCHRCFISLSARAEGIGGFQVRGANEEDVAFLLAVKSFHCMYILDQALAFRSEAEFLQ